MGFWHFSLQRALPVCDLLQLSGCYWDSGTCCSGVRLSCAPFVCTSASVCAQICFFLVNVMVNTLFEWSLFPDLTHTHTWISQTPASLAQPSPLGPSTWPRRTRTNCGSFAVRATWSRAKKVAETCSVTAPDAGEDTHRLTLTSPNYIVIVDKIISISVIVW